MKIKELREQIDNIDSELLLLLNKRTGLAVEIAKIKKDQVMPAYDPEREKHIFDRMITKNQGPLDSDGVKVLFERIVDESRRMQRVIIDKENI